MPAKSSMPPQRAAGVRASTLSCKPSISCGRAWSGRSRSSPAAWRWPGCCRQPGAGAGARELHDAAFACCVGRSKTGAEDRHHRADIDDLAAAGCLHRGIDRLRAQEGAGEVGLDHAVPFGDIERLRRLRILMPALLTRMSIRPSSRATRLTMAATAALSVTSAGRNRLGAACASSAAAAPTWLHCARRLRPPHRLPRGPGPCRAPFRHCPR